MVSRLKLTPTHRIHAPPTRGFGKFTAMKKHQFEEITMALSVLIALIAYAVDVNWLCYLFTFKAGMDAYCAIRAAYKSVMKDREKTMEDHDR